MTRRKRKTRHDDRLRRILAALRSRYLGWYRREKGWSYRTAQARYAGLRRRYSGERLALELRFLFSRLDAERKVAAYARRLGLKGKDRTAFIRRRLKEEIKERYESLKRKTLISPQRELAKRTHAKIRLTADGRPIKESIYVRKKVKGRRKPVTRYRVRRLTTLAAISRRRGVRKVNEFSFDFEDIHDFVRQMKEIETYVNRDDFLSFQFVYLHVHNKGRFSRTAFGDINGFLRVHEASSRYERLFRLYTTNDYNTAYRRGTATYDARLIPVAVRVYVYRET